MSKKDDKKKVEGKKPQKITLSTTPKSELRQIMGLDTRDRNKNKGKDKKE